MLRGATQPVGGGRGCTCRDPVIHDDGRAPGEIDRGTDAPDDLDASVEFGAFPALDRVDLLRRHLGTRDEVVVEHLDAAFRDGAHGDLGLPRDSEFAHDDDIQRRVERTSHLGCDRDPAARQAEHDRVAQVQRGERLREAAPGVGSVTICLHGQPSSVSSRPLLGEDRAVAIRALRLCRARHRSVELDPRPRASGCTGQKVPAHEKRAPLIKSEARSRFGTRAQRPASRSRSCGSQPGWRG